MKKINLKIQIVFSLLCYLMLFFCEYKLVIWIYDKNRTERINSALKETTSFNETEKDYTLVNPPEDENDYYWKYKDETFLDVDLNTLKETNSDTVGWIQVRGADIDYPIVQGTDNNYYLTHSFDKSNNKAGWIFSDYRNNLNQLNSNTVIYGHDMKDKSMFGTLENVLSDEWYQNTDNYVIKVSAEKENMIWQIFSIYTIYKESYYISTNFFNTELYQEFIDTIKNRSIYDFHTSIDTDDKILTLSTCSDSFGNRLVVHAKLIKKGTKLS